MALTKSQMKTIEAHRKEFGTKHATVMRHEMNKGKSTGEAHKIALKGK